ncbi:13648_t:CDS:2 [Entrophospora sp. SA101]|nr:4802_t:CDS:2 [Entrophospora sp. SA101]CAJ0752362.1 13648_t:CDS:2 [Entrophospora sp. SA101]CAJ0827751.1 9516_t:CDS:2 [Entrophospora sp. SA101]
MGALLGFSVGGILGWLSETLLNLLNPSPSVNKDGDGDYGDGYQQMKNLALIILKENM